MDSSLCRNEKHELSAELANSAVVATSSCTLVYTVASSTETVEEISRESNSESPQPLPDKKARKRQSRTELIVKEVKDLFFEMDRYFEERERVRLAEQREYEKFFCHPVLLPLEIGH